MIPEKRLIIMKACGSVNREYAAITAPLAQAYATRCNADFLCIYNENPDYPPQGYQKWAYVKYLDHYDRILYLDADLVVRSTTPDLFDLVPYYMFGAVDEYPFQDLTKEHPPIDRYDDLKLFDPLAKPTFYLNSGVYLFSKAHRNLFTEFNPKNTMRWGEQSHLNANLSYTPKVFLSLDPKFNHMKLMSDKNLDKSEAYIVHYAGAWGGLTTTQVLELMKKDIK